MATPPTNWPLRRHLDILRWAANGQRKWIEKTKKQVPAGCFLPFSHFGPRIILDYYKRQKPLFRHTCEPQVSPTHTRAQTSTCGFAGRCDIQAADNSRKEQNCHMKVAVTPARALLSECAESSAEAVQKVRSGLQREDAKQNESPRRYMCSLLSVLAAAK